MSPVRESFMRKLDGFFEVSYDRDRNLMRVTSYGFWNVDVVDQFNRALEEVSRTADPMCDSLVNICRTEIHSPEVSEALGRMSIKNAESGRIAVISPSMLLRMQVKRIQNVDATYRYFETEQEALDWLATPPGQPVSQARAAG